MKGGYLQKTGERELPEGARTEGAGGQAAVALPEDFPPPKRSQRMFANCDETSSRLSSFRGPQFQFGCVCGLFSPM